MTNTYKTPANWDYVITTTQLSDNEFMATTREFKAFGNTEWRALDKLAEMMRNAAGSINKLAIQRANEIYEASGKLLVDI